MRHQKRVRKLGHGAAHRKAILKNLVRNLIIHGRIVTTHRKAKEAQKLAERLVTYGKKDDVHHRRLAYRYLQDRELVKVLFDQIAPLYQNRNGGYTRVLHLGRRVNDAAEMSLLEYIDYIPASGNKKSEKKSEKKVESKKSREKKSEVDEEK